MTAREARKLTAWHRERLERGTWASRRLVRRALRRVRLACRAGDREASVGVGFSTPREVQVAADALSGRGFSAKVVDSGWECDRLVVRW